MLKFYFFSVVKNNVPPVFRGMASYFPRFPSSSRQNNASVISSSAHPPWADPQALAFFENKPANAPRRGQISCSNAPRYRQKKLVDFLVFELISILIKAKSGQTKSEISLISVYCFSDL